VWYSGMTNELCLSCQQFTTTHLCRLSDDRDVLLVGRKQWRSPGQWWSIYKYMGGVASVQHGLSGSSSQPGNNYLRVERQTPLCCHQQSRQPSPYRAMRSHTLIWSVKSSSRNTSIRTCNLSQKDPSRTEDPGYLARALALRPR
jgi:hypothetical protein